MCSLCYRIIYRTTDATRKERSIAKLMERLNECRAELTADKPTGRNKSYYERYFDVRRTPKRGLRVTLKEGAVDEYIKGQSGFWILYTNAEKDPAEPLRLYRRRSDVELLFDDLKNASDSRRLRVHSDAVMQGCLFISFLALVVLIRLKGMVRAIPAKERSHWNW
jgi:transposase